MWGIILFIIIVIVLTVGGYILFKYASEWVNNIIPEPPIPTPPLPIEQIPKDEKELGEDINLEEGPKEIF